ncbi:WXG100 family type VII secretion target [Humidisolicoccus flavus]|uniref:WXG100 family type VII secretion target n=1 Tax=Humidisolicoccus flavus TaxID=3111414 RepID=UPI003251CED5
MSRFVVDSDALRATEQQVRGTIARLQADVQAMHSQLQALQESWTGQASSAFQAVVSDWRSTQHRVEESISTITLLLGTAGNNYAEVESGIARMFRG